MPEKEEAMSGDMSGEKDMMGSGMDKDMNDKSKMMQKYLASCMNDCADNMIAEKICAAKPERSEENAKAYGEAEKESQPEMDDEDKMGGRYRRGGHLDGEHPEDNK